MVNPLRILLARSVPRAIVTVSLKSPIRIVVFLFPVP
jgi:hypothetical protein